MAWPVDGRGRQAPERSKDAPSEQQFHDEFIDAVVQASLPMLEGYGFPDGLDHTQARLYHATYLKHFSFFAWKFPSWLGAISDRCPFQDVRRTIIEDLVDEEVADMDAGGRCHVDILYEEAEACGMSRDEIVATDATPVVTTCVHAFENLARTLSWQGSLAAIASLEILQSVPAVKRRDEVLAELVDPAVIAAGKAARGSNSLAARTGLPAELLVFQAHHAYKDQEHGGGELALLLKYSTSRDIQKEMVWAAKASIGTYILMRKEIDTLAHTAVGLEPRQRTLFTNK